MCSAQELLFFRHHQNNHRYTHAHTGGNGDNDTLHIHRRLFFTLINSIGSLLSTLTAATTTHQLISPPPLLIPIRQQQHQRHSTTHSIAPLPASTLCYRVTLATALKAKKVSTCSSPRIKSPTGMVPSISDSEYLAFYCIRVSVVASFLTGTEDRGKKRGERNSDREKNATSNAIQRGVLGSLSALSFEFRMSAEPAPLG